MLSVIVLVAAMLGMLLAAELFTNSVEWLGHLLGLEEGAVGSVLAAVGTALPETLIPIIAIARGGAAARDVSAGAILGAPFMLSTLAMCVSGAAVLILRGRRAPHTAVHLDLPGARRDVTWFLCSFVPLILASLLPWRPARIALAVLLLAGYALYVRVALARTLEEHVPPPALHFGRREAPRPWLVLLQLLVALGLLTGAAEVFVTEVQAVAALAHIGLLALALLLVPLATELPEKFNSVSWLARRKDGLAIGNLTGAMVFQSAIPGAIGLAFTDWQLSSYSWLSSGIAVFSMVALWLVLRSGRPVSAWLLLGGGLLYGLYVADVLH